MIKVFKNENDLAYNLSLEILYQIKKNKKRYILGCPGGRSLKKTYYYLGRLSSKLNISLDKLVLVMMDEYVLIKNNKFKLVDSKEHYSCVRFSRNVIKKLLNYKKNKTNSLKNQNILFPEISNPKNYDHFIKKIGGIDLFLLASGSTDGHVAFNNKYCKENQKTHITKLSVETRKDNIKTFSKFTKLSEVPKFGITVGLGTITSLSKKSILVLAGKEKNKAFKKIKYLKKFDKIWPSSIIFNCKKYKIYADKLASS